MLAMKIIYTLWKSAFSNEMIGKLSLEVLNPEKCVAGIYKARS